MLLTKLPKFNTTAHNPSIKCRSIKKSLIKNGSDYDHLASDCTQILDYTGASKLTNLKILKSELRSFVRKKKGYETT